MATQQIKCPVCSKWFTRSSSTNKYCSVECGSMPFLSGRSATVLISDEADTKESIDLVQMTKKILFKGGI